MKQNGNEKNPYQNNRGGRIQAPASPAKGDPKATVIKGNTDLRNNKK